MVIKSQRFEFIDGLRGLAALSVVLFHLHVAIDHLIPSAFPSYLSQIFSFGYLGIQIFFVISGFVIAYSLRDIHINFAYFFNFFIKRSLRLDPPYWIVLGLTLLLAWVANLTFKSSEFYPFTPLQILYNFFYLPDLMQVPLIVPVAWTLCIEFQFYIFFVFLGFLLQRLPLASPLALAIWTGLSIFSLLQNTSLAIVPIKPVTFIPHWYSFFLGCCTCWSILGKVNKKFLLLNYGIIALGSLWTTTPHASISLATALLISFAYFQEGLHRYLSQKIFQYLGTISYSLYLIHWPVGMKLVHTGHKLISSNAVFLLFILSLLLTLLFADLFYRLIERPSHHLSRQFHLSKLFKARNKNLA